MEQGARGHARDHPQLRRALALGALAALGCGAAYAAALLARPDPSVQAAADGCGRELQPIFKKEAPTWAYVGDAGTEASGPPPGPRWVRGLARSARRDFGAHPAAVDDPITHDSYDFITNVRPAPAFQFLLGGNPGTGTGNFEGDGEAAGVLHTEWEQRAFGSFAWPDEGDRVTMLGSWVWDCGHWLPGGERTELHPLRAVWVERKPGTEGSGASPRSPLGEAEADLLVSTIGTFAGVSADCAHRTKGGRAAFRACVAAESDWQDVSGTYTFSLAAPPRPSPTARLAYRVVDAGSTGGAPTPRITLGRTGLKLTLRVATTPRARLVVAKRIFLGWRPVAAEALPEHLRVTFRSLLVRRAMDPGCPTASQCASGQSTRLDQISAGPGEWAVYWNVDGIWGTWKPSLFLARDGQVVPGGQTVDFYVPRTRGWRLFTFARECDFGNLSAGNPAAPPLPCRPSREFGSALGDDAPGSVIDRHESPRASLGSHTSNASLLGSSCPPANRTGCYALSYVVRRIDDAAARARTTR